MALSGSSGCYYSIVSQQGAEKISAAAWSAKASAMESLRLLMALFRLSA
jgi:hypothetical protein